MAHEPYPGGSARPLQVRALADEYRKAAAVLLKLGERGKPLTRAPFRLTAIHAVELYLNAFLLARGHGAEKIRGLQHDLPARAELAIDGGLSLRKRTLEHIRSLSAGREYLVSRYGPELAASMSQVNRLIATLDEVANKVTNALAIGPKSPRR